MPQPVDGPGQPHRFRRRHALPLATLPLAALLRATPARAERTRLGQVSAATGAAMALFAGTPPRALEVASPVLLEDLLTTGPDARLACLLEGGIALRLGANASLRVDALTLAGPRGQVALRSFGGPMVFDREASPAAAPPTTVILPWARIGVRGTRFFAGPLEDRLAVFVAHGQVVVTAGGASRRLAAGDGVDQPAAGGPLGPVQRWGMARIDQAMALVS
jgi:ferric-dicitrate binding protein FerR (iron transport regulator)